MNNNFLTIEEKRAWLARIFRDTSGFFTAADKLKALEADNRLVAMQANGQEKLDSLKNLRELHKLFALQSPARRRQMSCKKQHMGSSNQHGML